MKKGYSIKKRIISVMLVFMFLLIFLLTIYNAYSKQIIRDETARLNINTLNLYTELLDNSLSHIDSFLLEQIVNNNNFNILKEETDELKTHLATHKISATLKSALYSHEKASMFFVYSHWNNVQRENYRTEYGFQQKMNIRKQIMNLTRKEENYISRKWFPLEAGEHTFLIRLFGDKGTYVGAIVNIDQLVFPLSQMAIKDNYILTYNTGDGKPLNNREMIIKKNIRFRAGQEMYYLSGFPEKYMILNQPLQAGDLYMTVSIPEGAIAKELSRIQYMLLAISALIICIIPAILYLIRKTVLNPIDQFIQAINRLKEGHWDAKMELGNASSEFSLVCETFNSMIDEIQYLKIVAYEEKIEKQNAQLQYLIYQIKPHFFLNILNSIYGMSERKKYEEIQPMILSLSTHIRYIFKDNAQLVLMKDELDYVRNYLKIQTLCLAQPLRCNIEIKRNLLDLKIPPITIQTFVENSIKHAIRKNKQLEIFIKATTLDTEEGRFVNIIVSDNGNGYDNQTLEKLNSSEIRTSGDRSIGLANVKQRLLIVYKGKASTYFSNGIQGGAQAEMILPVYNSEKSE